MEGSNTKINMVSNKDSIDNRLFEITSKITTVEEWEKYISQYAPAFCSILAKLETKSNKCIVNNDEKPIAVITGGQPGSGKSALIDTYKNILKNNYNIDAVINNADFYRFCVPGSYKVAKDFPESASKVTDPVVKRMRKNLMEESIAQKQSIIIENTLGDTIAFDIMQEHNTHQIWLALMAVPREESLLSDFERYIKMKEACDVARLVSVEAHDKRYIALDKNAVDLENSGIRTLLHSRGKTENEPVILEYDSLDPKKNYRCVLEAIHEIRRRELKKGIRGYGDRLRNIRAKMEAFGMTHDEEEELKKLEAIINMTIIKEESREDI